MIHCPHSPYPNSFPVINVNGYKTNPMNLINLNYLYIHQLLWKHDMSCACAPQRFVDHRLPLDESRPAHPRRLATDPPKSNGYSLPGNVLLGSYCRGIDCKPVNLEHMYVGM